MQHKALGYYLLAKVEAGNFCRAEGIGPDNMLSATLNDVNPPTELLRNLTTELVVLQVEVVQV